MKLNEKVKQFLLEKIVENDFSRFNVSYQSDLEYKILEQITSDLKFINYGSICDNLREIPESKIKRTFQDYKISFEGRYFKINLKSLYWIRNIAQLLESYLRYDGNPANRPNLNIGKMISIMLSKRTMNHYKLFSFHLFMHHFKETFSDSEYIQVKKALMFGKFSFWKYILITMLKILQQNYPDLNSYKQNEQDYDFLDQESKTDGDSEQLIDESDSELKDLLSNPVKIREMYIEFQNLKTELENAREIADFLDLQLKEKDKEMSIKMNEIREEMKIEFFKTLNSVKSGQVLDNFMQVKHNLNKLKSQGWKPDKNIAQLEAIIYILDNFLKSQQITPIYNLNEVIDLKYSMLSKVNYRGEPFSDETDIKKVFVKTPGWHINENYISKPDVIEIKEGEK